MNISLRNGTWLAYLALGGSCILMVAGCSGGNNGGLGSSSGLTAPTSLNATPGNNLVSLKWMPVSGATNYKVQCSGTSGGPYVLVGSSSTNTFTDTSVSNGRTYYYVVTSLKGTAESGLSLEARVTPNAASLAAPTSLRSVSGNSQVSLSWNTVTNADSYTIRCSTTAGGPYVVIGSSTSTAFVDTGAINGKTFYYVVTAVKNGSESGHSNEVIGKPTA